MAVQLHNLVRAISCHFNPREKLLGFDVLLNYCFLKIPEQRHFGHRTFLVIGKLINLTPVSCTAVQLINNVINGNYHFSNAGVNEAENM
jgi:hypothetical protein